MKHSHYKTPRTMREAWGEDNGLNVDKIDTAWHWAAALALGAMVGFLLAMGVK